jgi:hypothetical protein
MQLSSVAPLAGGATTSGYDDDAMDVDGEARQEGEHASPARTDLRPLQQAVDGLQAVLNTAATGLATAEQSLSQVKLSAAFTEPAAWAVAPHAHAHGEQAQQQPGSLLQMMEQLQGQEATACVVRVAGVPWEAPPQATGSGAAGTPLQQLLAQHPRYLAAERRRLEAERGHKRCEAAVGAQIDKVSRG